MPTGNPIPGSVLYQDDGTLKRLKQELRENHAEMQALVKTANDFSAAIGKLKSSSKADRQKFDEAAIQLEKLTREKQKLELAESALQKQIEQTRQATAKQNAENRAAARLANALKDTEEELAAAYALNTIKLTQLTSAQKKHTTEGRNLVKITREQGAELRRLQHERASDTRNVGNYTSALGGVGRAATNLIATYISLSG